MKKKMRKEFWALLLVLVLGAFKNPESNATTHSEFKLVETKNKVILYEKWNTNSEGKQSRELKATFSIKKSIANIISTLHKETDGKKWNSNASKFEIKDITTTGWFNYIEYDLPWPLSNQDCVLKHHRSDLGTVYSVIDFESASHLSYPETLKNSRIPDIKGKWIFNKSGEEVKVEYYITTSPSTSMPRAITDPIVRGNIMNTMAAFRDLLEK